MKRTLICNVALWHMMACGLLFSAFPLPLFAQWGNVSRNTVDTFEFNRRMIRLANGDSTGRWPVKPVYPLAGAILPYYRVVAFYGNLFSKNMGILGQLPKEEMLKKLEAECAEWRKADPATPVMPALHYIAATAQPSPGKDKMYRYRMPATEIEKVIAWSREIKGITFLDIQTGHSTVKAEVAALEKFLMQPDVHLGIDPEYSMKNGGVPCTSIGTFDAQDINDAVDYLAMLVKRHALPPKILVVHRFTKNMVTNYKDIKVVPEVQVVMHMDGFGAKSLKLSSYTWFVSREPVQFAGFKLFYKIDKPTMYTPAEMMKLKPIPIYIQFQ
ncbi:MAG TPA: hypothetical protein VK907_06320 [Phnomibacter sp.]|nr:hypothetical protein [Phnomibacter sp.]